MNIGLVLTDSQDDASASVFRAYRAGVEARISLANAEGGINGRKITYRWEDDQGNVRQNLFAAQSLVGSDDVFGLIETTAVASGSAEYLNGKGIPVVGIGIERQWSEYRNMFTHSYTAVQGSSVTTWGQFVRERGGRRAVILVSADNDASISSAQQLGDSLRSVGVSLADTITVARGITSQTGLVQKIRSSGADTVIGALDGDTFAQTMVSARQAGLRVGLYMSAPPGYSQQTLRSYGSGIAGMVAFAHFAPFELGLPADEHLLKALGQYAPYLQPANQSGAGDGWIAADIFLRGLETGGSCPTRENFIEGLSQLTHYDAEGLLASPIDLGSQRAAVSPCWYFVQVNADGTQFEPIGRVPRCGEVIQGGAGSGSGSS
ncbi:ABC transporter substrate-binding protein [Parafrankia sp. EUN1f]|uniref:ABC transporter substrate-binding protein n=1 Tax=Parafrankia sp. EUN1f TaxID=102897 RepID=UPI0012F74F01|nr:ABC transporter substrate-binding protein [Parafrankia sp. EUN1f]